MYYWVCPFKAQISHIYMWLVVSRESYGECLRLFYCKWLNLNM